MVHHLRRPAKQTRPWQSQTDVELDTLEHENDFYRDNPAATESLAAPTPECP